MSRGNLARFDVLMRKHGLKCCAQVDDQFAIVPSHLADGYFDLEDVHHETAFLEGRTHATLPSDMGRAVRETYASAPNRDTWIQACGRIALRLDVSSRLSAYKQ